MKGKLMKVRKKPLAIEYVKTSELVPYAGNAKEHPADQIEQIKKSILDYGMNDPIAVWHGNEIIEGHGRLIACEELGIEEVPVIRLDDLTDEERREYALVHNKLTMNSGFDEMKIDFELSALPEFDADFFGFDASALEQEEEQGVAQEDGYNAEPPEEPRTKPGDIYRLGNHRLICGDSTDVKVLERLFDGERAEICVTSPPYNTGHMDAPKSKARGGGRDKSLEKKYLNDDDERTEAEYLDFICSNLDAVLSYSDEVFYNIGVVAGSKGVIGKIFNVYADRFKDLMYWEKENPVPNIIESVIASSVELIICLGQNGTRSFNHFNDRMFHGVIKGLSASTSNQYADIHKATFPVYLPSEIIERFSTKHGNVLDCFGGTGTTLVACEQLGRHCFMVELEPRYCDVIVDRWEKLTGKKAVLVNG